MLKAIVVDDEIRIRTGIASFINDNDFGFEVVHSFSDGAEAIDFLSSNDTDLIISDIRMSNISGLELAEYVYTHKPYIQMIILSGYADFEYARTAMQYGIQHYITKPTDFGKLKEALLRLRDIITLEKASKIDLFIDDLRNLCGDIISGSFSDAQKTMHGILNANRHNAAALGQFAYNVLDLIFNRLQSELQVQIPSDKFGYSKLSELDDHDAIYEYCDTVLSKLMAQFTKNDDAGNIAISKIIAFINGHFSENISLQDAAEKVFLNASYLSRYFKAQTGMNFSDYLLRVRMEEAARLLRENVKISEISIRCGYSNPGYFTRIFKEYYKATPSEFQRQLNG